MDLYVPPPLPLPTRHLGGFRAPQAWGWPGRLRPWGTGSSSPGGGVAGAGLRTAPAESCVLGPGRGAGAYLPARTLRSCPAAPPKAGSHFRAQSAAQALPRSEMPARGRPAGALRPASPLSLDSFDPQALRRTPRLQGCQGRPAGVLETVPSLSPFIKRPGAALKPRASNCFFQEALCGPDSSQSAPCLHSVIDSLLAECQPI